MILKKRRRGYYSRSMSYLSFDFEVIILRWGGWALAQNLNCVILAGILVASDKISESRRDIEKAATWVLFEVYGLVKFRF